MANPLQLPSLVAGTAIGGAAVAAFEPALERPKQDAWHAAPNRLPDIGLLAALVAGGKIELTSAQDMAKRLGYDTGPFDSLVWLAQNRLDFPLMLRLWRLGAALPQFNDPNANGLVDRTLAHEQLDWDYHPYLKALRLAELPGIGDIAYGVVRGILPSPSYVPVPPPTTSTNVQKYPQLNIDPEQLAAAIGYSPEMLELMVGRSGLSMAPVMAAQAYFRGILADDDYRLAIAEGDLRTEWADAVRGAARQIPTAGEFVEAWLRGWITQTEAENGAALHGMTAPHADMLYDIKGRPENVHAITTGLARGGVYPSQYSDVPEPYRKSLQESDIRPEWASIAYHNRYTYPSAFVLRTLAQAGDLGDQAAVEQVLLEIGWKPSFATQVSTAWVGGTGAADKHVAKAQTSLFSATHRSYVAEEIDDAAATTALAAAGVPAASVPGILTVWQAERALIRKQLSPTQIRKAVSGAVINPATGVAWTHADAMAALLARGYDQNDAETFLAE